MKNRPSELEHCVRKPLDAEERKQAGWEHCDEDVVRWARVYEYVSDIMDGVGGERVQHSFPSGSVFGYEQERLLCVHTDACKGICF